MPFPSFFFFFVFLLFHTFFISLSPFLFSASMFSILPSSLLLCRSISPIYAHFLVDSRESKARKNARDNLETRELKRESGRSWTWRKCECNQKLKRWKEEGRSSDRPPYPLNHQPSRHSPIHFAFPVSPHFVNFQFLPFIPLMLIHLIITLLLSDLHCISRPLQGNQTTRCLRDSDSHAFIVHRVSRIALRISDSFPIKLY